MEIIYGLSKKPTKETIDTCHESAMEFRKMMVNVCWFLGGLHLIALIPTWIVTRFYKVEIKDDAIIYDFYLITDSVKRE